ncbi:MAG TPA: hypothetical protein VGP21_08010, partial [Opitutaceae bacterium]|nr:hypothetical protein [Opitutaceae bacterium]
GNQGNEATGIRLAPNFQAGSAFAFDDRSPRGASLSSVQNISESMGFTLQTEIEIPHTARNDNSPVMGRFNPKML